MSQTLEKPKQTRDRGFISRTPANVERGLQTLALLGSPTKAAEETGIPEATLRRWAKDTHAARYHAIREQVMPRIHAEIAAESEDLARLWGQLERKGVEDLHETWDQLKTPEKSAALRNATVSRGISIDKASLLRGKPTSIVENRTPDELLRKLASSQVADVIDGEAEDITDAEIDTSQ